MTLKNNYLNYGMNLAIEISKSKLGKYEIVKRALNWMEKVNHLENYKNLTQVNLINRILMDVLSYKDEIQCQEKK
ncbi:MAG: hypothetical protein LBL53_02345 [Endomicrobium sp.]|jgi:hypothetical protein|nr:hypothetical protein [Endomicrobium sp.]